MSTSGTEITARSCTSVNSAILRREASSMCTSERHSRMSGCRPIARISFTECCVGLVLVSPAERM